jgi:peptide/nickel transport system substrate-binding protein
MFIKRFFCGAAMPHRKGHGILLRYFTLIVIFIIAGCDKIGKPAVDPLIQQYTAMQIAAEQFVPDVGQYGGEIILPAFSDPSSFNPITSDGQEAGELFQYIYEGLVRINPVTLKPEPCLASSWDISQDGLSWTFHIKPDVLWSDSVPFTAKDVDFTFNRLIYDDSINPNPAREIFTINGKHIAVHAADSITVTFLLPERYAPFLSAMTQAILPEHIYSRVAKIRKFATCLGVNASVDSVVGTGPFVLETMIPSQKTILKKNAFYWQKDEAGNRLPYLDRIILMTVSDHSMELSRLKKGEIDYVMANGEDWPGIKRDTASGFKIYETGPASGGTCLIFNCNGGTGDSGRPYVDSVKLSWFLDVNFRKAVAYSIDRKAIIDSVLNGKGYPQWSAMSPSDGAYFNPDVATYPCDQSKAADCMRSAGFSYNDRQHVWQDASGHTVAFTMLTSGGNTVREKIAAAICRNLERNGFKVSISTADFDSLMGITANPPYGWDAVLLGVSGNSEPQFNESFWRSSGMFHVWHPREKSPAAAWEAEVDAIFDSARIETDEGKRKVLFFRWQNIIAGNVPVIYTVLPERLICISSKIGNVNPSLYGGVLHSVERFYIKK